MRNQRSMKVFDDSRDNDFVVRSIKNMSQVQLDGIKDIANDLNNEIRKVLINEKDE